MGFVVAVVVVGGAVYLAGAYRYKTEAGLNWKWPLLFIA